MSKEVVAKFSIPIAIVIAGLLIAGSLLLTPQGAPQAGSGNSGARAHAADTNFRLPSAEDHVRGNPNASISVIEFSDFECPFCARLHPTLIRLIKEHEDVNWVYRHLPLTSIHRRALAASIASECVAKLGGNDAFWSFTDTVFANQHALSDTLYRDTARDLGVDSGALASCMEDRAIEDEIVRDLNEARSVGGSGTPFVVVVGPDGELTSFSGALPYEQIASVIEQVRN